MLRRVSIEELGVRARDARADEARRVAAAIVADVRERGEPAVREHAERLGDLAPGAPMVIEREQLERAYADLEHDQRGLLERTAARIRRFAEAQRDALRPLSIRVEGGWAGHELVPLERAGCYAPGGRYPLPSSVLMTTIPARVAGVAQVWVASPRPGPVTRAAAFLGGADALLATGGAQAIAALAHGAGAVPACDAVVGPGNRFVTAAKELVAGRVAIDVGAGPSELVVLADASAEPGLVAADLLAQAEHDPDARPGLVALDAGLIEAVERELERQLADLPTADVARAALDNGFALFEPDLGRALAACDALAPEHLELMVADAAAAARRVRHAGALFVGAASAEVLGDYGAGPNHVLPTDGGARARAGLSVLTFLRARTWLALDEPRSAAALARDAAALARLEGLEAHARAAERRAYSPPP